MWVAVFTLVFIILVSIWPNSCWKSCNFVKNPYIFQSNFPGFPGEKIPGAGGKNFGNFPGNPGREIPGGNPIPDLELVEESPLFPILSSSTFDVWSKTQETFKRSTGKFLVFSTLSHDVETKITRLEVSSVPKFEKNIWHHPNRFPFKKKVSLQNIIFISSQTCFYMTKKRERKTWQKLGQVPKPKLTCTKSSA